VIESLAQGVEGQQRGGLSLARLGEWASLNAFHQVSRGFEAFWVANAYARDTWVCFTRVACGTLCCDKLAVRSVIESLVQGVEGKQRGGLSLARLGEWVSFNAFHQVSGGMRVPVCVWGQDHLGLCCWV
jgi:hypothetical protein